MEQSTLEKKLLVEYKIVASCQTNISLKHFFKQQNNKNEIEKNSEVSNF